MINVRIKALQRVGKRPVLNAHLAYNRQTPDRQNYCKGNTNQKLSLVKVHTLLLCLLNDKCLASWHDAFTTQILCYSHFENSWPQPHFQQKMHFQSHTILCCISVNSQWNHSNVDVIAFYYQSWDATHNNDMTLPLPYYPANMSALTHGLQLVWTNWAVAWPQRIYKWFLWSI